MPRRRSRREPGRPTLLSAEVEKKLIEATKIGSPMNAAAAYCGISVRAFEDWMRRGHAEQSRIDEEEGAEPDPVEAKYLALYKKIVEARAHASVASVGLIRKAAVGGQVTETTTRRYRDAAGDIVEETTEKRTSGDWKAAAWWLERQNRSDFGKETTVNQNVSGQVTVGVKADELAARISTNIARRQEQLAIEVGPSDGGEPVDAEVVE